MSGAGREPRFARPSSPTNGFSLGNVGCVCLAGGPSHCRRLSARGGGQVGLHRGVVEAVLQLELKGREIELHEQREDHLFARVDPEIGVVATAPAVGAGRP